MKPIKYRAWDKVLKEWNTTFLINSEGLIYKNVRDLEDGANTFDLELLQNTGLKDKNGIKEIYEGDIVRTDDYLGVVNHRTDWFIDTTKKDEDTDYKSIDKIWALKKIEIIGNIYESPDLLDNK